MESTTTVNKPVDVSMTSIPLVEAPSGYKILNEGLAHILYQEEKLEVDENNMIKTMKGKRMANE